MTTFANWFLAAILALLIAASCNLPGSDDHASEWDRSASLQELQASAENTERREQAAIALCTEQRGPGAAVLWTADGDLVCRAIAVRVAGAGL